MNLNTTPNTTLNTAQNTTPSDAPSAANMTSIATMMVMNRVGNGDYRADVARKHTLGHGSVSNALVVVSGVSNTCGPVWVTVEIQYRSGDMDLTTAIDATTTTLFPVDAVVEIGDKDGYVRLANGKTVKVNAEVAAQMLVAFRR